jgi:hypothetical protein
VSGAIVLLGCPRFSYPARRVGDVRIERRPLRGLRSRKAERRSLMSTNRCRGSVGDGTKSSSMIGTGWRASPFVQRAGAPS